MNMKYGIHDNDDPGEYVLVLGERMFALGYSELAAEARRARGWLCGSSAEYLGFVAEYLERVRSEAGQELGQEEMAQMNYILAGIAYAFRRANGQE